MQAQTTPPNGDAPAGPTLGVNGHRDESIEDIFVVPNTQGANNPAEPLRKFPGIDKPGEWLGWGIMSDTQKLAVGAASVLEQAKTGKLDRDVILWRLQAASVAVGADARARYEAVASGQVRKKFIGNVGMAGILDRYSQAEQGNGRKP